MGKSGCGKSTLERSLIDNWPGIFKKVISSTTRPKRKGEEHGKDYWFLTEAEYDNTDFIQTTKFADYRYGSSVNEYQTEHPFPILCVVPSSAKIFTDTLAERFPTWRTFNIYFDISPERLMANMRKRGDTEEMIEERIAKDTLDQQFIDSGLVADLTVDDYDLDDKGYYKFVAEQVYFTKVRLQIRNESRINWNI
jgi:guanylate kinase